MTKRSYVCLKLMFPHSYFSYPFCGKDSPADFPIPVINGENVAPVLNTLPAETIAYQAVQIHDYILWFSYMSPWKGLKGYPLNFSLKMTPWSIKFCKLKFLDCKKKNVKIWMILARLTYDVLNSTTVKTVRDLK